MTKIVKKVSWITPSGTPCDSYNGARKLAKVQAVACWLEMQDIPWSTYGGTAKFAGRLLRDWNMSRKGQKKEPSNG